MRRRSVRTTKYLSYLDIQQLQPGESLTRELPVFQHYILEINAFGDFFPGWQDERGRTIYQAQLESYLGVRLA